MMTIASFAAANFVAFNKESPAPDLPEQRFPEQRTAKPPQAPPALRDTPCLIENFSMIILASTRALAACQRANGWGFRVND